MKFKIYQVDAFTSELFSGNPAAVCPLKEWPSDELMQKIAMENNLAETAFYVQYGDIYEIRWFTPAVEVDLCGHATLASAFVLYHLEGHDSPQINFYSPRSGKLVVTRDEDMLTLDFPSDVYYRAEITGDIAGCFDVAPLEAFKGKTDYLLLFSSEEEIEKLRPNLQKIAALKARGVIVTARGNEVDFVSRFFAPQSGINEDPVTGSAHTTLTPFWFERLGKVEMTAMQLSSREGHLKCTYLDDRIKISGNARLYMTGELFID